MQDQIERLRQEVAKAEAGGGEQAQQKQHAKGKLLARERLHKLCDEGSFTEIDRFVTSRFSEFGMDKKHFHGDGVVTGFGKINGQKVFLAAEDFTVLGGSLGEMHANKIAHMQELAIETGAPFIQINDSGGARIQEGIASLNGYGRMFKANTQASGVIPQISLILGPCAGGAVYSPGITDFVFMVPKVSHMFITGPQVIKTVTGEEVSFDALGGARVHSELSGVNHFECGSEADAFHQVRRLLSFLPANNQGSAPRAEAVDPVVDQARIAELVPADPRQSYDVRDVIEALVDGGDFMEVHARFARNAVVGFARFGGRSVGMVANQAAHLAGVLDINASDKIARFVRFCDAFNLPLVNLVDVPGFLPGVDQEHQGIIRHGAKILFAYSDAVVPKISCILRKAYGGAYIGMCSKDMGYDRILALPTARIAVMGSEGAVNILHRRELAKADNVEEARKALVDKFEESFATPYAAAGLGLVDNVVEPVALRDEIIAALDMLESKRVPEALRRHGNMPL